ncbi:histidine kinase [Nostoc sp.]
MGAGGAGEDEGDKENAPCPMPHAPCPMPHAPFPSPQIRQIVKYFV